MRFFLSRRKTILILLTVVCVLTAFLGTVLIVHAAADDEVNYIYFDLAAGNVTINGSSYIGYAYQKNDDDNFTLITISGALKENEAYYVYQSVGGATAPDGYFTQDAEGVKTFTIPQRDPVTIDGQLWRDYITNNTDVVGVINAWINKSGRTATGNSITVSGKVNATVVIDNIYSTKADKSNSRTTGGISFHMLGTSGASQLTVKTIGDNRVNNIHFATGSYTDKKLIIDEQKIGSTLTVADINTTGNYNYWNSAIGSTDSYDNSRGIVIKGGTVFAGTTTANDCTAIGAGGNGIGDVTIEGGTVTAVTSSSGAAIGGGIGKTAKGGQANVTITGGEIYAYNFSCSSGGYSKQSVAYIPAAAIGGGSSARETCNPSTIEITGGRVYAQSVGGTAIGGGSSADNHGGSSTVKIGGNAYVEAKSIAGTINGTEVPAGVSIGGGTGGKADGRNGGNVTLTIEGDPTVIVGSIGGGKTISPTGNIGAATVKVSGGSIQGQIIMAAGSSTSCSFNMSGGTIDNSEKDASFIFLEENGGAIFMDDPNGVAELSGGVISNCSALNGGALYMTAGKFTLSGDGEITDCSAERNGGAVYMGGGTFTMSGGALSNNQAVNGASAYLADGTMTISGGSIDQNAASQYGGAIYMGGGTLTVSGGTLSQNTAIDGASAYLADGTMTISGGSVSQNSASQYGGAIYMGGGTLEVSGGTLSNNTAINGAGAYLENGEMTVSGTGSLSGNTASQNGGAIYMGGGTLTVSGGTLSNNTAINGAGAYLADGTMTVSGGSISQNVATQDGGGAYLAGGTFSVSGGSLSNNTATNGGGALIANGNVIVSGGTISQNTAAQNGGAFSITNGNYTMTGGSVTLNKATNGDGGAIYVSSSQDNSNITIRSGSVTGNIAGMNGGALGVRGQDGVHFTITIGSKTNHAGLVNSHVCITDSNLHETCPVIEGNTASVSGGGIYLSGSYEAEMNMHCLVENGNKVGEQGVSPSNFMKVEGGTLNINTAGDNAEEECGNIVINSSVHVTGGKVTIEGSGSNPMFKEPITVDVDTEQGSTFVDNREGGDARTIQYFENFERDGQTSGQYVLIDFLSTEAHTVRANMYSVTGYAMDGWILMVPDGNGGLVPSGNLYNAGDTVTESGDLIFYAKWVVVGYTVVFTPGVDSYQGSMEPQDFAYSDSKALTENEFVNVGYIFLHWVDASDATKIYADGAVVSALTDVHGAKITLVAVWKVCEHLDMESYTLTSTTNSATRQCPCLGYSETVTLSGVNKVYNTHAHPATVTYDRKTLNDLSPDAIWNFTVLYNGTSYGDIALNQDPNAPVNAGNYTASIKITDDLTISVDVIINRADRDVAPNTPEYDTTIDDKGTDDKSDDMNIILVKDPEDTTGYPLEYQFSWYEGTTLKQSAWIPLDLSNLPQQELEITYTNYYVDVRYQETANYNASATVRGTSVIVWTGNVIFKFSSGEGLSHSHVGSDAKDGITVTLTPLDGYYIYNITTTIPEIQGYTLPQMENTETKNDRWVIWIHDIASATEEVTINVSFSGAEKLATVDSSTVQDAVFGDISNEAENDVTISCDSSYTVFFNVNYYKHYGNPMITFSREIPAGSTLIMMDLSDSSYWSYTATEGVSSVVLTEFVRMGTANEAFVADDRTGFKLQFIVDFSGCETTLDANAFEVFLSATPIQPAELATVPGLPATDDAISSVTLVSRPVFSVSKGTGSSDNDLSQTVSYQFALSTGSGVGISKWNNLCGILVIEPVEVSLLPADARLQVKIGDLTRIYPLINGKFTVALPEIGAGTASLTLLSDMFPNADASFEFSVRLCASASKVKTTPTASALYAGTVSLTYKTNLVLRPSVHAAVKGDFPQFDGRDITALNFVVSVEDLPQNYTVRALLYGKNENGGYTSTTQTMELEIVDNKFDGSMDLSSFKEGMNQTIGSLSLMLKVEIVDSTGMVVESVPLYFILVDTRQ